ncbi:RpiB/LacA/LacB family sugar-phosphate isomerase [Patescibacteria group bacterium]|nr:RpiB/LacA/LacB family sugar-phosphate isomerase [Patescibacteria group bacterium]MCL5010494.1 RpiB/LacA/LacB family sugar-phosphate isomerase [Patescibacteria group bacterium]
MKIYLAADHAGFELKERVKNHLAEKGYEVEDCGAFSFNKDDDYPDLISKAAQKVSRSLGDLGIIFGGSGQGEAIVANKYKNIRCSVFFGSDTSMVKFFRTHNDANMLSVGARFTDKKTALRAIELFLKIPFSNEERHKRRIEKIKKIEESQKLKFKSQNFE